MEPDPGKDDVTMRAATPRTRSFASGRYVVRRILGEGGQKIVYLVHDNALDRECALSMIKSEMLDDDQLQRLRREAQSMARLGAHSNIVTVHDIGEEDGKPFLVSEYVPAGELREELRKAGGPLPIERALAIARDVTRALAVAHAHGVVHRDLKPANIWLCADGSAKLGDFGLAFSLDRSRLTMPGMMMGTAAYMAPEQALGQPVSERSDLYSLGVVMYEMVCGRPPFVDENPTAVIAQHLNAWPVAPTTHNSEVPASLEALILQLLAKPPAMRPTNAVRVGEELRRIADGLRKTAGAVNVAVAPPGHAATSPAKSAGVRLPVDASSAGRKRRMSLIGVSVGLIVAMGIAGSAWALTRSGSSVPITPTPGPQLPSQSTIELAVRHANDVYSEAFGSLRPELLASVFADGALDSTSERKLSECVANNTPQENHNTQFAVEAFNSDSPTSAHIETRETWTFSGCGDTGQATYHEQYNLERRGESWIIICNSFQNIDTGSGTATPCAKSGVAPASTATQSHPVGDAPAIDLGPPSPPRSAPSDCRGSRVVGQFDGNVLVCLVGINSDQSHTYEVTVTKVDGRGSAIVALCTEEVPTGNCPHLNFDQAGFTVDGCSISVLQFNQTFIGDPVVNRVNFVDPVSKTEVLSQGLLGDKEAAGGQCEGGAAPTHSTSELGIEFIKTARCCPT